MFGKFTLKLFLAVFTTLIVAETSLAGCFESLVSALEGKKFQLLAEDAVYDMELKLNSNKVLVVEGKGLAHDGNRKLTLNSMIISRESSFASGIKESVYLEEPQQLYIQYHLRRDPWNSVKIHFWIPIGAEDGHEVLVKQTFTSDPNGSATNKFRMYLKWINK